jgi:hypothetical protein
MNSRGIVEGNRAVCFRPVSDVDQCISAWMRLSSLTLSQRVLTFIGGAHHLDSYLSRLLHNLRDSRREA